MLLGTAEQGPPGHEALQLLRSANPESDVGRFLRAASPPRLRSCQSEPRTNQSCGGSVTWPQNRKRLFLLLAPRVLAGPQSACARVVQLRRGERWLRPRHLGRFGAYNFPTFSDFSSAAHLVPWEPS